MNAEQSKIIFDDPDRRGTLIVAAAGSGKTTTIVLRIKQLVDSGISEENIILTTFTKDAAQDMENKLTSVFGYKPKVVVGTIDSIALKYVKRFKPELLESSSSNVGEYAVKFLEFLQSSEAKDVFLCMFSHMFIDEFQDINDVQYKIIHEFYKTGICVTAIGDDAQNIYTFRGSNVKYILHFNHYFPDSHTYMLTTNYRSTQDIVNFANASIEKNEHQIPKVMVSRTGKTTSNKPKVHYFETQKKHYEFVKNKICEFISSGYKPNEIAVLCPQNSHLYKIEELLTKEHIPNILLDGKSDVRTQVKKDHVCLSTIHKSKGLEWSVVFIIMLNDEIFPSKKDANAINESRRLFYVGITRPKKHLHICYAPVNDCHFVCRFISEINREYYDFYNWRPDCFGSSLNSYSSFKLDVTSLLQMLDGEDYVKMKELELFPELQPDTIQLYAPHVYSQFVHDNSIYADFGIFIDTLITRMIGETWKNQDGFHNESAILAISCIKLDFQENAIYNKYRVNFSNNLPFIAKYLDDVEENYEEIFKGFVKRSIHKGARSLDSKDIGMVLSILEKIYLTAKKCRVPCERVPLFTETFLPKGFEERMLASLDHYRDTSKTWKEILLHIWEVSKCELIVKDKRRRLLYKNIVPQDIKQCHSLYEDTADKLMDYLKRYNDPKCHEYFRSTTGISGELDVRFGDIIFDYKCSQDEKVQAEHILQLLCYKQLYEESTEKPINKIGIINPLKGIVTTYNVEHYDKGAKLFDFLLQKANKI